MKSHFCVENGWSELNLEPLNLVKSHFGVENGGSELLSPEPLNLVKSHFCFENGGSGLESGAPKHRESHFYIENGRSERKSGALQKWRWTTLKPAFWHLRVKLPPCFWGGRVGSCRVGRRFAFSYSFWTTRPRFARATRYESNKMKRFQLRYLFKRFLRMLIFLFFQSYHDYFRMVADRASFSFLGRKERWYDWNWWKTIWRRKIQIGKNEEQNAHHTHYNCSFSIVLTSCATFYIVWDLRRQPLKVAMITWHSWTSTPVA